MTLTSLSSKGNSFPQHRTSNNRRHTYNNDMQWHTVCLCLLCNSLWSADLIVVLLKRNSLLLDLSQDSGLVLTRWCFSVWRFSQKNKLEYLNALGLNMNRFAVPPVSSCGIIAISNHFVLFPALFCEACWIHKLIMPRLLLYIHL